MEVILVETDGTEHIEVGRLAHPLGEGSEFGGRVRGHVDESRGGHCVVLGSYISRFDNGQVIWAEVDSAVGLHEVNKLNGRGRTVLGEEIDSVLASLEGNVVRVERIKDSDSVGRGRSL